MRNRIMWIVAVALGAFVTPLHAHDKAHTIERHARYAPELGWRGILAVLTIPDAQQHLGALATPLQMLVSQYGDQFIDRIEREAAISPPFKECLAAIHPSPIFPFPEHLWPRLTAAAGTPIGPMAPHVAALYKEIPDLSTLATCGAIGPMGV